MVYSDPGGRAAIVVAADRFHDPYFFLKSASSSGARGRRRAVGGACDSTTRWLEKAVVPALILATVLLVLGAGAADRPGPSTAPTLDPLRPGLLPTRPSWRKLALVVYLAGVPRAKKPR